MARFCTSCGEALPEGARFCGACGAPAEGSAPPRRSLFDDHDDPPPPSPPPPPAAEAPPREDPAQPPEAPPPPGDGADLRTFADQLGAQLRAPGMLIALAGGIGAFLGAVLVGAVTAAVTRDLWALGVLGLEAGVVTEAARVALQSVLVRAQVFGGETTAFGVIAWTAFPVAGAFLGGRVLGRRSGLAPWARPAWGLLAAAVFVVLAIPLVVLADGAEYATSVGSLFLYAILIAGGATAAGAWSSREHRVARPVTALLAGILRPLAVAAAVLGVFGLLVSSGLILTNTIARLGWDLQPLQQGNLSSEADDLDLRLPNALGQSIVASPNYALLLAGEGMLSQNSVTSLPGSDVKWDELSPAEREREVADLFDEDDERLRIFDADDALPPYLFLPVLIVVLLVPNAAALYAGFVAARRMRAPTALLGAAWGALVGIVWAVVLTIVDGLLASELHGDSLFWSVLLFGTLFGAIGGLMGAQRRAAAAPAG